MNRRGIALVVVLWGLLLVGAMALSFSAAMRTEAQAARNGADGTRAYYLARTGINRAVALFSSLPREEAWRRTVAPEGEEGYDVAVEDEGGKIDVNTAPAEWIRSAVASAGAGMEEAEGVARAIADWRSPEGIGESRATLASEYAALPEPIVPRYGKLASLDELRSARHVSPETYRRAVAPIFTVHGSAQVNVNTASPAVLRAVGLAPSLVDRLLLLREEEPFRSPVRLVSLLAAEGAPPEAARRLAVQSPSGVFTVTARGRAGGVERRVRCRFEAKGTGSPRILHWEDLVPAEEGS